MNWLNFNKLPILAFCLLSGIAGWFANGWRLNEKISRINLAHAEQVAVANADALRRYAELEKKKQEAIDETNEVSRRNNLAAAGARDQLERLRQQLKTSSYRLSTATHASTSRYAETASVVFSECGGRLEKMARDADQYALEAETLMKAWPK